MVARDLLGKILVHNSPDGESVGRIIETEAYIGPYDQASHAFGGLKSKRTEVQFGPGGHAYVYLIYGMYCCFNVVTQKAGLPEVVLIRALNPIRGLNLMMKRMGIESVKNPIFLTNGPGKLSKAMGITLEFNGTDLCGDELFLSDDGKKFPLKKITRTPRINIDYAREAKNYLWRFVLI